MTYVARKNPWLGALLVLICGSFGFLYYSWRKALVTFLLYLVPSLLLYEVKTDSAEVVRWSVQATLAAYAYMDLSGRMDLVMRAVGGLIQVLSIPIILLNLAGVIIGAVWLIFLGQWGLVVSCTFITFMIPYAYMLISLVQMPLMGLIAYAQNSKKKGLCMTAGFANLLIGHAIILVYVLLVQDYMARVSSDKGINLAVLLLFGYGMATSPFSYMASKDGPDATGSLIAAFIAQLAYIILSVAQLTDTVLLSLPIVLMLVFSLETFIMCQASLGWDAEVAPEAKTWYESVNDEGAA